jgi:thiol-disulfide isomerase/thioredoxin
MKQTIFTILILFLLAFNVKAEKTFIIGRILNYTSLDKEVYFSNSLQVSYYSLIWIEEIESVIIENDGSFQITFDLPFAQDIYITSGTGLYIAYLATPGEKIELNLTYELTNQKFQGLPSPFYLPKFENAFVGKSKLKQDKFYKFYYGWLIKERIADQIISENEDIIEQINSIKIRMNSYFKDNPNQKELYAWGYNYLFFSVLMQNIDNKKEIDLKNLKYPLQTGVQSRQFSWGLNRISFTVLDSFFKKYGDYISTEMKKGILRDSTIQLSAYEKKLIQSINSETRLSKKDSLLMNELTNKLSNSEILAEFQDSLIFQTKIDHIVDELPTYIADIIIAQQIIENFESEEKCKYINEESVKNFTISLIEKWKTSKDLNISEFIFPEDHLISSIKNKYKGKRIYIDIWATWCGGCRAEFPKYKEIIDEYENMVKFVFLCVSSPEKIYLNILNTLDFNAEHYFVSAKQYEELKVNYEVASLPHYIFIKPDGTVINKTYRPSDKTKLFKLFDEIN